VRLASSPAGPRLEPDHPLRQLEGDEPARPAELVCPLCQGVLSETTVGAFHHFRCHVGHSFSLPTLARAQSEDTERALWASVRSLEESAALSERLARAEAGQLGQRYAEKAATLMGQAELIRQILLQGDRLTNPGETPRSG